MDIIKNYKAALQELYDHVGFREDWVVLPIDDRTDMFWRINDNEDKVVYFFELEYLPIKDGDEADRGGNFYSDEIYKQRFYTEHVYRGKDYTMIMVDTHTDGNRFFAFYDNKKEVIGDSIQNIETTEKFWDCECEHNYIHPKTTKDCKLCKAKQEDSIISEVIKQGFKI